MKSFVYLSVIGLVLMLQMACQNNTGDNLPNDLNQLRELQKEKRSELKEIENEVSRIEQKIDSLDTGRVEQVPLVTVDTLVKRDFNHYVEVQGRVVSQDNVNAASEMGGTLTKLLVEEGDKVSRGSLIARVDDNTLLSQKKEIETQLELARDVYQRQKRLWEKEIGSEVEYLRAKNQVENLEQRLKTLETNIKKTNVYAPKTGVVDEVYIKEGMFAAPGSPIATIIDHRRLKVKLEVPENYLGKVSEGENLKIKYPTIDFQHEARVTRIGSTINRNNRTFIAEAKINSDQNDLIRPNMLAVGMINDYHRDTVIQVPVDLVQQEVSGKDYVYVKGMSKEGPVAVKKYVEMGKVAQGMAEIESGLKEGQVLLVVGARGLAENERIRVQESSSNYPLEQ